MARYLRSLAIRDPDLLYARAMALAAGLSRWRMAAVGLVIVGLPLLASRRTAGLGGLGIVAGGWLWWRARRRWRLIQQGYREVVADDGRAGKTAQGRAESPFTPTRTAS